VRHCPHLLVALTAHGFGHTTQTAPVVNALRKRLPALRLTLSTDVPHDLLAARFEGTFAHVPGTREVGMVMNSAVDVLAEESAHAYARLHANWQHKIVIEAARLKKLNPDLVLANVPYLTLAAARRAGIPAVALCSLNWADMYAHYCASHPDSEKIHAQILAAYNSADVFLQTEPSMPMHSIRTRRSIGPVARLGKNRRAEINARLGLVGDERLVLIAPGGITLPLPIENWPRIPKVRWLVMQDWGVDHPDALPLETLRMHFIDVMCSCDALLGKPGYGSFAEAACNGVPVLYVSRDGWPEQSYLIAWLQQHGRCLEVPRAALDKGDIAAALERLWKMPVPACPVLSGAQQAANYLFENYFVNFADAPA
jgi:hypothetical protein